MQENGDDDDDDADRFAAASFSSAVKEFLSIEWISASSASISSPDAHCTPFSGSALVLLLLLLLLEVVVSFDDDDDVDEEEEESGDDGDDAPPYLSMVFPIIDWARL